MKAFFPESSKKGGREVKVHVECKLVFNNLALRLNAALPGLGLAYLPEDRCSRTSQPDSSFVCPVIGARRSQGATSITQAVTNLRRRSQ